jgi:hypothetical protein
MTVKVRVRGVEAVQRSGAGGATRALSSAECGSGAASVRSTSQAVVARTSTAKASSARRIQRPGSGGASAGGGHAADSDESSSGRRAQARRGGAAAAVEAQVRRRRVEGVEAAVGHGRSHQTRRTERVSWRGSPGITASGEDALAR